MTTHKNTELPVIHKSGDFFATFDHIQNIIRERANRIFHDRKPDQGNDISDWLSAESEVLADIHLTLQDDEDQVLIEGNMKGFLPKEIEVKANDGLFQISGTHSEKSNIKKKGSSTTTSQQINFCKSFSLPGSVDTDKMKVKLKNGLFKASIPKTSH
ncbi:MAG: Hsp20/alpha crystallin family protein [Gammaproteobacteria bacterium]|nr:Hsp20/alpha crystallin family protein [Gammaproteobacteria bacterium]